MPSTHVIDDEIAQHLKHLSLQQKQMVLVVLQTMTAQNKAGKPPANSTKKELKEAE